MPRGIPNKKRRKRTNGEAEVAEGAELDTDGTATVSGESEEPPTLGEAVEIVRSTLQHFDVDSRKSVVKAATMLLK